MKLMPSSASSSKSPASQTQMDPDTAARIIIRPYVTERTFGMVETDSKICFLVDRSAKKHDIVQAIKSLYNKNALDVNTARTIYGKKAFVKFENTETARDLATDVGMI